MHLNINYLIPKFEEIKMLLNEHKEIEIFGISETFLNDSFSDKEFQINGYQFRKINNQMVEVFL
jgi:hypothetical protein